VASKLVVGSPGHLEQAAAPVRRRKLEGVRVTRLDQLLEGGVEGAAGEPIRLRLVDHPEAGIEPGGRRMGGEEPATEPVDGRDPGAVGRLLGGAKGLELLARGLLGPLGQRLPDPAAKLVGRPFGEGEGEDPLDPDLGIERGGAEPIDEDGGLAGARPGPQEDVAVELGGGRELLIGALRRGHPSASSSSERGSSSGSPRSRRQIGWKVQ
jgi:hypothetical protein